MIKLWIAMPKFVWMVNIDGQALVSSGVNLVQVNLGNDETWGHSW